MAATSAVHRRRTKGLAAFAARARLLARSEVATKSVEVPCCGPALVTPPAAVASPRRRRCGRARDAAALPAPLRPKTCGSSSDPRSTTVAREGSGRTDVTAAATGAAALRAGLAEARATGAAAATSDAKTDWPSTHGSSRTAAAAVPTATACARAVSSARTFDRCEIVAHSAHSELRPCTQRGDGAVG